MEQGNNFYNKMDLEEAMAYLKILQQQFYGRSTKPE
jgi:hypothetical protein